MMTFKNIFVISCVALISLSARAEEVFKVGALFSLTGWAAPGGTTELNAIRLAIDEINLNGGLKGRKVEVVVEDNQSDLKKAVSSAQKLINVDKVNLVFGPNWAEFCDVVAPVFEQAGVPMITASGYSPTLTLGRKYVFTLLPDHDLIVQPLADYVISKKHERVALVSNAMTYYQSLAASFKGFLQAKEINFADFSEWNPGTVDFKSYILKLKSKGISAVVLFLAQGGDLASFLRQARELNFKATIYTSNAPLYDDILKKTPDLLEGVTLFEYRTNTAQEFFSKYRARFGESDSHSIPRAYDSAYLLKACEAKLSELGACLHNVDYRGVSGRIRFTTTGNLVPDGPQSELFQFVGGKMRSINN
jgi:branched-chain amino acid transport system substrate-binding protein